MGRMIEEPNRIFGSKLLMEAKVLVLFGLVSRTFSLLDAKDFSH